MTVADRLDIILNELKNATDKARRAPDSVQLVAVSKTYAAPVIREAVEAGQIHFGESRIQEAKTKIPELPSNLQWHLIGHLQSNKTRLALSLFPTIHTVDSLSLAHTIDRIAGELGLFPTIFLQVNISGEATKYGMSPAQLEENFEEILNLSRLEITGLMTIPPISPDPEGARKHFAALREFRDSLEQRFATRLPHLSMGMSNDFPIAIEEGATHVRIGSAIFGKR